MDVTAAGVVFRGAESPHDIVSPFSHDLFELIRRCEVVSFDVFDTLLVRRVAKPTDVFEMVGRQQGVPQFRRLRIAAEARARERKREACGHPEVNLEDIYLELEREFSPRAHEIKTAELSVERLVLRSNPAIHAIYAAAANAGKVVVATSDMYLPTAFIADILIGAGLQVVEIFVSGDIGKSKHNGNLFGHVADCLGLEPGRIVHIGDNVEADFKSALKAGCSAWHYVSNSDKLFRDTRYNQGAISRLVGSDGNLLASLVVAHLATRSAVSSELYGPDLFGRMYAGPIILAFVRWVEHIRKLDGVTRLYLLTRDGYILEDALRIIGSDAQCVVVHSSRRMCLLAALEMDFEKTCLHIASSGMGSTPRDVVKGLQVANESGLLWALDLIIDISIEISDVQGVERFAKALRQCREILVRISREERAVLLDYLQPLRLNEPDAALVDCGWALSTHQRLEMLTGERIRGYYVGTIDHAYHHDGIRSFLFEKGIPSPWKSIHLDAVELLELPFIAAERQSVRMIRKSETILPEMSAVDESVENVRSILANVIRREALTFCRAAVVFSSYVRVAEAEEALQMLFEPLSRFPTSFEYFSLSTIPHTRAFGAHGVNTIGDFWRCSYTQEPTFGVMVKRDLLHYFRFGLLSLSRDGLLVTFQRTRRKLLSWIGMRGPLFR